MVVGLDLGLGVFGEPVRKTRDADVDRACGLERSVAGIKFGDTFDLRQSEHTVFIPRILHWNVPVLTHYRAALLLGAVISRLRLQEERVDRVNLGAVDVKAYLG